MRIHYLSDLHLESQTFDVRLPTGDVLIIAGDLCHARALDPARGDKYSIDMRSRVLRFIDYAAANFSHVIFVAGNHEHYDGVFDETVDLLRHHLPAVTILNNETIEIDGITIFGSTLWSDFESRSTAALDRVRRRLGDYFFIKTLESDGTLVKFQPEHALRAFDAAWTALRGALTATDSKPTLVVTHHAPSYKGLNPQCVGNGLDGAFASHLDKAIEAISKPLAWIHGHTHIARTYRIGDTVVCSNARGFVSRGQGARGFSPNAHIDIVSDQIVMDATRGRPARKKRA